MTAPSNEVSDQSPNYGNLAMYRSAAKRLLPALCRLRKVTNHSIQGISIVNNKPRFLTSATSETTPNKNSRHFDHASSSSSSSTATMAGLNDDEKAREHDHDGQGSRTSRPGRTQHLDEQARVLHASLHHVVSTSPPFSIFF